MSLAPTANSSRASKTKKKPEKEPTTEAELFSRIVHNARFFLERCTEVLDSSSKGLVPFLFNAFQDAYYERVWMRDIKRDVLPKPRKWGFSTQRVGLGLHGCMYTEGRWCRVVAHKEKTALELNRTTKRFYESAQRHFVKLGLDPDYFLPRLKFDNKREYYFPDIDSAIIFDTARGAGIGQSDRSDDLYLTEYSTWPDAEDKRGALVSSLPIGGEGRATIDFNADGIGNDAYVQYQLAKKKGQDDWNGYEPVFFGINDFPGVYSEVFLDGQRKELGKFFVQWYPSNDREMFLRSEAAVFEPLDVAVNDQFGELILTVKKPKFVCVPSTKEVLE